MDVGDIKIFISKDNKKYGKYVWNGNYLECLEFYR